MRELVQAALIQSANDAAAALADHVGGGDRAAFVGLMNAKARSLGLRDTRFANADGLDAPGHYSSARDVTTLARVAMRNPAIRRIVRTKETTISGGRRLRTWNDLLDTFPGLLGVKTGHTSGAGWSQVAAARGPGFVVYATLLGEPTRSRRNDDLTRLLAWGISQFRQMPIVKAGRTYATAALPYDKGRLGLVAARDQLRVLRLGQAAHGRGRQPGHGLAADRQGAAARLGTGLPAGPGDSLLAARRVTGRHCAEPPRSCRLARGRDRRERLGLDFVIT